jgi:hypothetical protein
MINKTEAGKGVKLAKIVLWDGSWKMLVQEDQLNGTLHM